VKAWFQILEDTLVGTRVDPYSAKVFTRENKHPKFYFFDPGVAWASTGQDFNEIPSEFKGYQFESLILNEIQTYLECHRKRFQIYFLSVPQLGDVDFIIQVKKKNLSNPERIVSIEVKASKDWKNGFEKMSLELRAKAPQKVHKSLAIYLGTQRLTKKDLEIFPLQEFVKELWAGKLL
jgi:predicted AAA+ superfamily ATPase